MQHGSLISRRFLTLWKLTNTLITLEKFNLYESIRLWKVCQFRESHANILHIPLSFHCNRSTPKSRQSGRNVSSVFSFTSRFAVEWFIQYTSTSFRVGRKRIIVSFQTDLQTRCALGRAFFEVRNIKYATCNGAVWSEHRRLSKEYYKRGHILRVALWGVRKNALAPF